MQIVVSRKAQPMIDQNQLLASLAADVRERMASSFEPVSLALGQVIYQTGDTEHFVYFPNDCLLSMLYVLENGKSMEVSVVGNDGFLGTSALLESGMSWTMAAVQQAGSAYRIPASVLRQELQHNPVLWRLVLRYMQAAMTQTALVAACNRHHTILQQLCRKLLFSLDRVNGNELTLTQEVLGDTLGVRREGVTEAAGLLRALGAINYSRGRIKVLERSMLEDLSCECHSVLGLQTQRQTPCHAPGTAAGTRQQFGQGIKRPASVA